MPRRRKVDVARAVEDATLLLSDHIDQLKVLKRPLAPHEFWQLDRAVTTLHQLRRDTEGAIPKKVLERMSPEDLDTITASSRGTAFDRGHRCRAVRGRRPPGVRARLVRAVHVEHLAVVGDPVPRARERFLRELRAPDSRALMAVLAEEPDTFCGWMLTKPHANEIVAGYTRRPLRRKFGLGSTLARAAASTSSCRSASGSGRMPPSAWQRNHPGYGRLYHKVTDEETIPLDAVLLRVGHEPARNHRAPRA
jgi:hypothetical protein